MTARQLFSFPNPVNELSARLVAGGVVTMAVAAIVFGQFWLLIPLAYGFVARVLTGPTLSPLGSLVTKVITPRLPLPAKYVPGPPKRFAQGIGATFSVAAVIAYFGFGSSGAAYVLLGHVVAARHLGKPHARHGLAPLHAVRAQNGCDRSLQGSPIDSE